MNFTKTVFVACAMLVNAQAHPAELPSIQPVPYVDLPRYMGNWYVIATIPTRYEKNACNALEIYSLKANGDVDTSFHFNEGAFDGERKQIHSVGIVKRDSGNAIWGVQVFWPLKAQYIVAYLKEDYSQVIVARDARDYVWVMARTPAIADGDYDALLARVAAMGYPMEKIRKVPQQIQP